MLSIVTHAEGRRAPLDRLLAAIGRMRPRPFEVVVVDRGGPPVRPRPDLPVRVTTLPPDAGAAAPAARLHGARVACGSLLLFLDVDLLPAPDLAGEVRSALARRDGLVVARVQDRPTDGAAVALAADPSGPVAAPEPLPPERFEAGAFAMRRSVLGHLERAAAHGDGKGGMEFADVGDAAARAGVPIWSWPTAVVHRRSGAAATRQEAHA